jgi:choline dehydrogenase-like flavoprotein
VADVDSYDILVVGSGESGKYLAWTMAAAGHRTAVIEQKLRLRPKDSPCFSHT